MRLPQLVMTAAAVLLAASAHVVRSPLFPASSSHPRLGRFDLEPNGVEPDPFAPREVAKRLCAAAGRRIAPKPAKLIDTFPFHRETDMIAIKLRELHGIVDHFVTLDGSQTFAGKPSRAWLSDGLLDGLGPWLNRSVHPITLAENPACEEVYGQAANLVVPAKFAANATAARLWRCGWAQEFHRRRVLMDFALERLELHEHDVIVQSDADEVLSREAAAVLKHCEWELIAASSMGEAKSIVPVVSLHNFALDNHLPAMWEVIRVARVGQIRRLGTPAISTARYTGMPQSFGQPGMHVTALLAGGWHMSTFCSPVTAARKLLASVCTDGVNARTSDRNRIEACMLAGLDGWGRPDTVKFTSAAGAAQLQDFLHPDDYEFFYGSKRVPLLMKEYPEHFGERRQWVPTGARDKMPASVRADLTARCRI